MTGDLLSAHMRVFATLVLLGFLAWVANLVRHHRLSLRDSLLWLLSTTAALLVTIFPQALAWVARVLQIAVPANALFALTFLYVLLNLLSVTIAVSSGSARLRRLTQECALLRGELELLRKERGSATPGSASAADSAPVTAGRDAGADR